MNLELERLLEERLELRGEDIYLKNEGRPVSSWMNQNGYRVLSIPLGARGLEKRVWFHRAKFFLFFGWLPEVVEHRNRSSGDNSLANLRPATQAQNMLNRKAWDRDLPRGVYKPKRGKGFVAACTFRKKRHHLGYFKTPEEASNAVEAFRLAKHGEFYACD